ncbi:ABC transporter domain-containing protein [Phthorimaea operculella]|nr:ABC transporter domain-containing protein [Phthorimaea operculella]
MIQRHLYARDDVHVTHTPFILLLRYVGRTPGGGPDAMLVHQVHKLYKTCCKAPHVAVQGLSISVKRGECFGLLGVNGAGKTTAFKMITAEEMPTRGKVMANNVFLKWMRNSTEDTKTVSNRPPADDTLASDGHVKPSVPVAVYDGGRYTTMSEACYSQ